MATRSLTCATKIARCTRHEHLHSFDFLLPVFSYTPASSRHISSTSPQQATTAPSSPTNPTSLTSQGHTTTTTTTTTTAAATSPPKKLKPLTPSQRTYLSSALRVNQAGELAATRIYLAQTPPLVAAHPHLRPLMKHMYDQEAGHLTTFNALLAKHRIRPTAMYPLWSLLSSGLGWATALGGREAAMACTEAVETEIGGHYNAQVRGLIEIVTAWKEDGYDVGDEIGGLLGDLRRIRDEELEHLDHAVEQDAKMARPYAVLTGVIRAGCRGAIWVSEKV